LLQANEFMQKNRYILTLSCPDIAGIVAAVSGFLRDNGGFILESAQFGDPYSGRFFMRTYFSAAKPAQDLERKFATIAGHFKMDWRLYDTAVKPRVLLMVSKQGHCFNDILHRYSTGNLQIEIPAVVSNHKDLAKMAEWYEIPFHYLPLENLPPPLRGRAGVGGHGHTEELENASTPPPNPLPQGEGGSKKLQEKAILALTEDLKIDLIVLARYMQILSSGVAEAWRGRAINIHHSFLPSFKGAKPYHQAYERGVKIIGATAHYITSDLDEGPIIDQEITRVDHTHTPEDLRALGQDIENQVLARAVKLHIEHRVLLNGNKTVIFR